MWKYESKSGPGPVQKEVPMIKLAFYGKGGIGKSTLVSNLALLLAERGLRVVQIGCDPKADSTRFLREGKSLPTVMDKIRERVPFALSDVLIRGREGVLLAEAGGPLPGRGCAGRGIITALEKLEELGLYETCRPDVVLYDVLGDVVCGGFAMPMRSSYAERVYILTSGEAMSVYAAANIAMALKSFEGRGYADLGGFILNRRDVPREEERVRDLAADFGAEVTGALSRSPKYQEAEEAGLPLVLLAPESPEAGELSALADAILPPEERKG